MAALHQTGARTQALDPPREHHGQQEHQAAADERGENRRLQATAKERLVDEPLPLPRCEHHAPGELSSVEDGDHRDVEVLSPLEVPLSTGGLAEHLLARLRRAPATGATHLGPRPTPARPLLSPEDPAAPATLGAAPRLWHPPWR